MPPLCRRRRLRYLQINVSPSSPSDTSSLTIVATDKSDAVIGFLALNTSPTRLPTREGESSQDLVRGAWDKWMMQNFSLDKNVLKLHNTAFISFFVCDTEHGSQILENCFTTVFRVLPLIHFISYLQPDTLIPFAPFSSPRGSILLEKTQSPITSNFFVEVAPVDKLPHTLLLCVRKDFLPPFIIRRARVEDCDDLVPIFKTNGLLEGQDGDHYIAKLVQNTKDSFAMVAEV